MAEGYIRDGSYSSQTPIGKVDQLDHEVVGGLAVLDKDRLSKIDKSLSTRELNRELALLYARGRAELLERELAGNEEAKNKLLEEPRS